jgi:L-ascorbate metabolism protein UlaG (beta-lactamase superfamily)
MAGKYPMGIMRIYTAMVERVKIFHDCPSLKLYRSRLLQSWAQEDNSVSISWLGTAGVLVSDGKIGILIDPYVSRFGFFKIAMGLHLQPNKDLVKSWTARHGNRCVSGGIRSTLNAGRGASLEEERLKAVKPGQTITLRAFTLKFIESSHVPAFLGRVPYP